MSEGDEKKTLKEYNLHLQTFHKRVGPKLRLIDDLSLSCDVCKTAEAKAKLKRLILLEYKPVLTEQQRLSKLLQNLQKTNPKPSKGFEKEVVKIYKKFTEFKLSPNSKLKIKPKLKGLPSLEFQLKF